jgi:AcrR family transcriptional regulator
VTTRDEQVYDVLADAGVRHAQMRQHIVEKLAAAGLLRPDPTGGDREALAAALWRFLQGGDENDSPIRVYGRQEDVYDAILAAGFSRPRGPLTEASAVTREQVEAAAAAIYEIDPTPRCGDGSWAALLSAARDGTMTGAIAASIADDRRESARAALAAALGIEVRGGEPS